MNEIVNDDKNINKEIIVDYFWYFIPPSFLAKDLYKVNEAIKRKLQFELIIHY